MQKQKYNKNTQTKEGHVGIHTDPNSKYFEANGEPTADLILQNLRSLKETIGTNATAVCLETRTVDDAKKKLYSRPELGSAVDTEVSSKCCHRNKCA